jgi:hypothetical protein
MSSSSDTGRIVAKAIDDLSAAVKAGNLSAKQIVDRLDRASVLAWSAVTGNKRKHQKDDDDEDENEKDKENDDDDEDEEDGRPAKRARNTASSAAAAAAAAPARKRKTPIVVWMSQNVQKAVAKGRTSKELEARVALPVVFASKREFEACHDEGFYPRADKAFEIWCDEHPGWTLSESDSPSNETEPELLFRGPLHYDAYVVDRTYIIDDSVLPDGTPVNAPSRAKLQAPE